MSDFIPVLAVGIIILALLIGIFGFIDTQPRYKITPSLFNEEETSATESGLVGVPSEQLFHQTLDRNFSVSYKSSEIMPVNFENEVVKSGLLSKKELITQFDIDNLEDVESAKIKYKVRDTNLYGNIIFVLNNEVIFNNYSLPGVHELEINKSKLRKTNTIRIVGQNSGWKIWAPTTYVLDFEIVLNYFSSKPRTYFFKKVKGVTGARLVVTFDKTEGDGNFIAKVNGEEIYRDRPKRILIKDFPTSLLKERNKIEFLADRNSNYKIKEAEILLFFTPESVTKTVNYKISESRYNNIEGANLTFYIKQITGDVISLLVKVTNQKGTYRMLVQDILKEDQYYSVNISKSALAVGDNKIELVSSGDGAFVIENITVRDLTR